MRSHHVARGVLGLAVVAWAVVLGRLIVLRHNGLGTFDFDLGIHDQSLWLLAHGKSFNTVCGLAVFGHHAMFAYYALVPLVWLGGGPNLWNVLQVVALAITAVPVFLLARARLRGEWVALPLALSWLLLPTVGFLAWETFHPEAMALPFLVMAYHHATAGPVEDRNRFTRRDLVSAAWLLAAVAWKEDIALAVAMMGVVLALRGRRRFGLAVSGAAAVYFVAVGVALVAALAGEATAYSSLFGELGRTPMDLVRTSLRHPSLVLRRLWENDPLAYLGRTFLPLGLLSLLSPLVVVIAVPQMAINLLTINDFTRLPYYHYQAVPVAMAMIAAVEGVGFVARHRRRLGAVVAAGVLVSSAITCRFWGVIPFTDYYDDGFWVLDGRSTVGFEVALERIGPDDAVSAWYGYVPQLTHREQVYTFPNPWVASNFLAGPSALPSPSEIRWIVVPDGALHGAEEQLFEDILARGEYGDVRSVAGVSTYRRLVP